MCRLSSLLGVLACLLSACAPPDPPTGIGIGPLIACDDPAEGFDRLNDEAVARGLDFDMDYLADFVAICPSGAGVVAMDFDADGDVDLAFGSYPGFPRLYENDGTGHFSERSTGHPESGRLEVGTPPIESDAGYFGAADLDGDRLPELLLMNLGWAAIAPNLGDFQFGPARDALRVDPVDGLYPRFQTASFGDVDGDGDLDLLLPSVHAAPAPGPGGAGNHDQPGDLWDPWSDYLLRNVGDLEFEVMRELAPRGGVGYSQVAVMTDRDLDGDPDIFVPSEFGFAPGVQPSAFYRNDGAQSGEVVLVDDAPEIGAALRVGAMGIDAADLNGDGRLDYCVSNLGPISCILSDPSGIYVESGAALGLNLPPVSGPEEWMWSAYSLDLADYDNDGNLDLSIVAGPPNREDPFPDHIDMIFQGLPDGSFADRTDDVGFGDPRRHFGLASADFDEDGALDMIVSGSEGRPVLWMNRCTPGSFVDVTLVGPEPNIQGFGAIVRVTAGGRTQLRELFNLRAVGQGPARLHFGLGDAELVDRLEVLWPDGAASVAESLPVRRVLEVTHPDRVASE